MKKLLSFNKIMLKGQESKYWNFLCRWLMGWGVGAHAVAVFLFVMAVT